MVGLIGASGQGRGFVRGKIVDEILKHGHMPDRQIFKLHPTAPGCELLPGAFRDIGIIHYFALDLVHMNETTIAAEDFYPGTPSVFGFIYGQVLNAESTHADIPDLPHVDDLIGSDKSSECPILAFEPLEFSFILKHFSPGHVRVRLRFPKSKFGKGLPQKHPGSEHQCQLPEI